MAWCHQATSHYLNQCQLRSMSPYCVTSTTGRLQWVKMNNRVPILLFQHGCQDDLPFLLVSVYVWVCAHILGCFVLKLALTAWKLFTLVNLGQCHTWWRSHWQFFPELSCDLQILVNGSQYLSHPSYIIMRDDSKHCQNLPAFAGNNSPKVIIKAWCCLCKTRRFLTYQDVKCQQNLPIMNEWKW